MGGTDYKDLKSPREQTVKATAMAARNAVHLAKLLEKSAYPGEK